MSAIGTKRTSLVAPHMSAFGGKADIDQAYVLAPQNFTPREHCCASPIAGSGARLSAVRS